MIDRNNRRCTAFHEAGHAVAASVQGLSFGKVFVVQQVDFYQGTQGELLGRLERNISLLDFKGKPEEAKKEVITSLAGPIAETFAYDGMECNLQEDHPDMKDAVRFVRYAFCPLTNNKNGSVTFDAADATTQQLMKNAMDTNIKAAGEFVNAHRAAITRVAEALLERSELMPDQVAQLCQGSQ